MTQRNINLGVSLVAVAVGVGMGAGAWYLRYGNGTGTGGEGTQGAAREASTRGPSSSNQGVDLGGGGRGTGPEGNMIGVGGAGGAREDVRPLGVPWKNGVTFEEQARAFRASNDEFERVAAIDAWETAGEVRALPLLAQWSVTEVTGRGGEYLAGAHLRALGSLGRISKDEATRRAAAEVLVATVTAGAKDSSPRVLGDALIACDALVALGRKEVGASLLPLFVEKALPWPLAERVALTLEALGAPEMHAAGKGLAALVVETPNGTFRAMGKEDKARLEGLAQRLAP